MASTIGFDTVIAYLNGLIELSGTIGGSPHKAFWQVDYDAFVSGTVPHVKCQGATIPIINSANPEQSPFYLSLIDPNGFCDKGQMPGGGPFITEDDLEILLEDGTSVTGKQVRDDLATWLRNGYPKDPTPIQ